MNRMKKLPLPMAGLVLALFALGNLLENRSTILRHIFAILGIIGVIMMLIRLFSTTDSFREEMKNPVIASVFPTFAMALMLFGQYLARFSVTVGKIIWGIGIVLHIILIITFSVNFLGKNFSLKNVFPSWFIVYVGPAVASVSCPPFEGQKIGQAIFVFSFIAYLVLLVVVINRLTTLGLKNPPQKPLIVILAAPASLLLAGYLNSFEVKNTYIVGFLAVLSVFFYFLSLFLMIRGGKLSFMPSFSAYTFPLVISGIATKLTNGYFKASNTGYNLTALVYLQEIIATIAVVFVLIGYLNFIVKMKE